MSPEIDCGDIDDAAGILIRKRLEQHGVDDAENRSICSNAERERKHGDNGEAGIFSQHSDCKFDVLPKSLHFVHPEFPIVELLDTADSAG